MNLSATSWHARLYSLMYGSDTELPTNLCPYFWKLFWAILWVIPLGGFSLLTHIVLFVGATVHRNRYDFQEEFQGLFSGPLLGISLIVNTGGFLLFCMTYTLFHLHAALADPHPGYFATIGFISWVMGIGAAVVYGLISLIEFLTNKYARTTPKESTPNLLWEFIKAKKQKYCPKINWK